jgi:hypothetical protein
MTASSVALDVLRSTSVLSACSRPAANHAAIEKPGCLHTNGIRSNAIALGAEMTIRQQRSRIGMLHGGAPAMAIWQRHPYVRRFIPASAPPFHSARRTPSPFRTRVVRGQPCLRSNSRPAESGRNSRPPDRGFVVRPRSGVRPAGSLPDGRTRWDRAAGHLPAPAPNPAAWPTLHR